jgi:WD40 repeat protein
MSTTTRRPAFAALLALASLAGTALAADPADDAKKYAETIRSALAEVRDGKLDAAKTTLATTDEKLRGFEYRHLLAMTEAGAGADPDARIGRLALTKDESVASVLIAADNSRAFVAGPTTSLKVVDLRGVAIYEPIALDEKGLTDKQQYITSLSASGDRAVVLAGTTLGTVHLIDGKLMKSVRSFEAGAGAVTGVAMSPDGDHIATVVQGGKVTVWKSDGTKVAEAGESMNFGRPIAFTHDSKFLGLGGMGQIELLDAATGGPIGSCGSHGPYVMNIAFSVDGKLVASGARGSMDKSVYVFSRDDCKQLHRMSEHTRGINSVAFSPDSRRLLSSSGDGTVRLYDTASGVEMFKIEVGRACGSAGFSPDGKWLVWATGKGAERLGPQTSK